MRLFLTFNKTGNNDPVNGFRAESRVSAGGPSPPHAIRSLPLAPSGEDCPYDRKAILSAPKERFSDRGKNPSLAADFTYERPGRRVRDLRTAERPLSAISLLTINKMTEGR